MPAAPRRWGRSYRSLNFRVTRIGDPTCYAAKDDIEALLEPTGFVGAIHPGARLLRFGEGGQPIRPRAPPTNRRSRLAGERIPLLARFQSRCRGWQRIGFEPNRNICNQQTAAYAADGVRFRQVNHFLPFSDADRTREAFHANGTTTCRFESDSETRWIVDFGDDYRCNLLLEDIYPFDGRRYPTFATGTTLENGLFLP